MESVRKNIQARPLYWTAGAFLIGLGTMVLLSACATTGPTQEDIHASIYKLYHVTPQTINKKDEKGLTPLYEAVRLNDNDAVKLFLSHPEINIYTKPSALLRAAYNGNAEITELLLKKGARVNEPSKNGETALMLAARKEHVDVVKVLLKYGAKPNAKNKLGSTPIMKAALKGNVGIVNLLIEAGADLNETNRFGRNALIYAIAKDRNHLALGLIQPGVDVNIQDKKGNSPLFYAAKNRNLGVIKKLIQAGAKVGLENTEKKTLKLASQNGYTEIVQSLIQAQKETL